MALAQGLALALAQVLALALAQENQLEDSSLDPLLVEILLDLQYLEPQK
jgi:hypothetical protein